MNTQFEKKLKEKGFSFQCQTDDYYVLRHNDDSTGNVIVQLIYSEISEEVIHISNNGNEIEAIGYFKLKLMYKVNESDILVLTFQNNINRVIEFIIIPRIELIKRLRRENWHSTDTQEIEVVFWLMPGNQLYETTNIGVEGEWYYLSMGLHRMADQTERDYSEFLNRWDILTKS
jgi:hypothetical protein